MNDQIPQLSGSTIQERSNAFHTGHPEVCACLLALCFELKRKGFERYGIRSLWERVRWHFQVEKKLGADFKLSEHFHSRYVRRILKDHPELGGFFELRELRAV